MANPSEEARLTPAERGQRLMHPRGRELSEQSWSQVAISLQEHQGRTGSAEHGEEDPENVQGLTANPVLADMEPGWANTFPFLVEVLGLALVALVMGVGSYGYGYVVDDLLKKWLSASGTHEYPADTDASADEQVHQAQNGAVLWIFICWAGGTAVGVLKSIVGLDAFPSFLTEIREQHADPRESAKVCLCAMASLVSGAALGPEAGLAAAGGGLGTAVALGISRVLRSSPEDSEERRRFFVLGGLVAAFGTILPSPWVAVLISMEVSFLKRDREGKTLVIWGRKWLFVLGFEATGAFMISYWIHRLAGDPIKSIPIPGVALELQYTNDLPWKALLLGLISAVAGTVHFICLAICQRIFGRLRSALEARCGKAARIICLCSLAGLLTGLLGYYVPLSLTDGESGLAFLLQRAPQMSTSYLIGVALAKSASNSVATAGGLVGGPFFPIIYIACVVGELAARIPHLGNAGHPFFTVPVCMSALPGAIIPMPFTLLAFPLSQFKLGPLWCTPIFVGVLTSYTLIVGTGFIQKLAGKASRSA